MTVSEFVVVPALLLNTPGLPAPFARITALVREGGYLTVSRCLQELREDELQPAVDAMLTARQGVTAYVPVALFVSLLAGHEGLVVMEDERIATWMTQFLLLLQLEQQARKGAVNLDYLRATLEYAGLAGLPVAENSQVKLENIQLRFMEGDPSAQQ